MVDDGTTQRGLRTAQQTHRGVIGRRIALSLLAIIVLTGASGWLGVRAWTARAEGSGYALSLTYPRVARSGLDIPWELRLTHPGGFSGNIVIAVSANYFDIFEFQGMHPNPSGETADADYVYLTFSPPPSGDVFTVSLDTYVQPASQVGRSATVKAMIGGRTVTQVHYSTWLVP